MGIMLKGCRRCGGDLFPDREDREGRTLSCLQCGLRVRFVRVAYSCIRSRVPAAPSGSLPA